MNDSTSAEYREAFDSEWQTYRRRPRTAAGAAEAFRWGFSAGWELGRRALGERESDT